MDLIKNGASNDPDLVGVDRITLDKNLNLCVQPEKKPGVTILYKLVRGDTPADYKYDIQHKEVISETFTKGPAIKGSPDNSQSSDRPLKSADPSAPADKAATPILHKPSGEAAPICLIDSDEE